MPDTALERALDELYAADPADFVNVRKQLMSDLRAAGDRAGANQLKSARRPSTAAWALNQMARREPQLVAALLERSRALQAAQSRPQSGQLDTMQDVIRAHRVALADATDAALAMLGERANDTFRTELVSPLRAASSDAEVGHQLETGRMIREADGTSGFPDSAHLTLVPQPAAPAPRPPKKVAAVPDRVHEHEREVAARADREQRREQEREAARAADRARRDDALAAAATAADEADRAEARIKELEAELDNTRRDLRDARARSRKATAEASRITSRLD